MLLGRSATRNRSKSRSPVPPSAELPNAERTFLPPSHYAAAGGFVYGGGPGLKHTMPESDWSSAPSRSSPRLEPQRGQNRDHQGGNGTITSELHRWQQKSSGEHDNHIAEDSRSIPHLESQLLPSLRDTIDRMTRPPSRAAPAASQSGPTAEDFPNSPVLTPRRAGTPKPNANLYSTAIRNEVPSTPKPRPKSVLKSALRSPGPSIFSKCNDGASASPSMAAATLVKNAITRKFSSSSASDGLTETIGKLKVMPAERSSAERAPRSRSRTDPGAPCAPNTAPNAAPLQTSTPQPYYKPTFKSGNTSQLPRFQVRGKMDVSGTQTNSQRTRHLLNSSTDDSELELRFERDVTARRRLVVANVDAFSASSSDSDTDGGSRKSRLPVFSRALKQSSQQSKDRPANVIGLGVNIHAGQDSLKTFRQPGLEHRPWTATNDGDNDDDQSIYDGDNDSVVISPTGQAAFGTASNEVSDAQKRRQTALLGIVDGLAFGGADAPKIPSELSSDSSYYGEDGVAVSLSTDRRELLVSGPDEASTPARQPLPSLIVSQDSEHYLNQNQGSSDPWERRNRARERLSSAPSNTTSRQSMKPSPVLSSKTSDAFDMQRTSSRSPVIRSGANSNGPAAIQKRLSFYYDNREGGDAERNQNIAGDYETPRGQIDYRQGESNDDLSSKRDENREGSSALPHADSDLSSAAASSVWHDDTGEELSFGAEALFRKLSDTESGGSKRRETCISDVDGSRYRHQRTPEAPRQSVRSPSPISQSSSASSVSHYENEDDLGKSETFANDPTWKSDLPEDVYNILLSRHGEREAQRQQLIWDICETEATFVLRLQTTTRLFVAPLRAKHSNTWIAGVPLEVAKLFDWLDDITALHVQMLGALQAARTAQYPVVERIADAIRQFVPRLEVYQPYLARLVDVSSLINHQLRDGSSDFAQFVTMQQAIPDCGGWTLDQLLADPVGRLTKYPDFYNRLLNLTPKHHPDYLPGMVLSRSVNLMIHVMTEVKLREDEYELTKRISQSISGLPHAIELAKRDRRLLLEGILIKLDDENSSTKDHCPSKAKTLEDRTPATMRVRNSRLLDTIREWDSRRRRAGSVKSTSSGSTGMSFGTCSSASSGFPATPTSDGFASDFRGTTPQHSLSKLQTSKFPLGDEEQPSGSGNFQAQLSHRVFVFTDLVLFACPERSQASDDAYWTLAKEYGLARVIGVQERQTEDAERQVMIILDVVALDSGSLDSIPDSGHVKSLCFTVPPERSPWESSAPVNSTTHKSWVAALRKCHQFTLKAMSIPSCYGAMRIIHVKDDPGAQQSVQSLVSSGLPIPKSPSAQFEIVRRGEHGSAVSREREERGWWSLRFQQVFREFQREDSPFFAAPDLQVVAS